MPWFFSLLFLGLGVLLVIKTRWIYMFTGPIDWAETHLGSAGGTELMIKLIGVIVIIGVFLSWTGLLQKMILGFFGPLFGK